VDGLSAIRKLLFWPAALVGRNGVRGSEPYFVVTATVDNPTYLNQQFIRTYNFKKQPDASGWEPTPCLPR
jgi:hypothetical protein